MNHQLHSSTIHTHSPRQLKNASEEHQMSLLQTMDSPNRTVLVTARCHCQRHHFTASIPASSLPLHASLCHCTSCRHNTGALFFSCAVWPNADEDLSRLKRYPFSPSTDVFSCAACSSQLFCRDTMAPGQPPEVLTSALENRPGLVRYSRHIFVGDTVDGGASVLLGQWADGQPLPRWRGHKNSSEELPSTWPYGEQDKAEHGAASLFTRLRCHCKGVNLFLRDAHGMADRPRVVMDARPAARQSVSADIVFWARFSMRNIIPDPHMSAASLFKSERELEMAVSQGDPRIGTLLRDIRPPREGQTASTYSCKVCSATFFQVHEGRPDEIFVTLGIMDHPDGARAQGLVSWGYAGIVGHGESVGWRRLLCDVADDAWRGMGSGTYTPI